METPNFESLGRTSRWATPLWETAWKKIYENMPEHRHEQMWTDLILVARGKENSPIEIADTLINAYYIGRQRAIATFN